MYGALVQVIDILNTIKKDLCQKKFICVSFSTSHEGGKLWKGRHLTCFISFWFNKKFFNWSRVDSQCCVNFWRTASGSAIHTHFLIFFSMTVYHRIVSILPSHDTADPFVYSFRMEQFPSAHPKVQVHPPNPPSTWGPPVCALSVSLVSVSWMGSFVPYFRSHVWVISCGV